MTDILDLPDWTLLAKRHDDDEYELEAEYRLLPGACVKCGSVGRLYKHGTKDTTFRDSPIRGHPVRDQLAITMTLDLGALGEQDVTFAVIYSPATPAVRYLSNGDPGYPGDPAELEVISAKVGDVDITTLLLENDDLYDRLLTEVDEWMREEEDRDR